MSTPCAPSSEKARASASSSSSAPKSACRNARLRESTRSTVSRYGRAAFISRPSTPTSMSWRFSDWTRIEVVLDALRHPLLVLRGGEHGDQRAHQVAELLDLVAVEGVVALVVAAQALARAADEAVHRPVHPEVEDHGDDREERQQYGGDLQGRLAVDDVHEEEEGCGQADGHDGRRLQLEADASLLSEATASLLLGWLGRDWPRFGGLLVPTHGIGRCVKSMIDAAVWLRRPAVGRGRAENARGRVSR